MSREIYVRRLPAEIDDEGIRRLFAVAGKVGFIHRVKDARTGEFRGTVFIKMGSEAEAKEAIELLDGARIDGADISVALARPQTAASASAPAADGGRPAGGKSKPKPRSGRPGSGGRRR